MPAKSKEEYIANVEFHLNQLSEEAELARENPILLAGSGKTLDQLPPPPSEQQKWNAKHGSHYQYFINIGRDQYGPIDVWGCVDCRAPEPDALEKKGTWAMAIQQKVRAI